MHFQTFGNKLLTYGAWIIPLMVAISAFGGLCVHIMASSRMCFVGARNGHMPAVLSFINVNHFTPVPSLVFLVSCVQSHWLVILNLKLFLKHQMIKLTIVVVVVYFITIDVGH